MRTLLLVVVSAVLSACVQGQSAATASKGTIKMMNSDTLPGNLLPQFMFMMGAIEGGSVGVKLGGGRGTPHPFVPDDSCGDDIFEGAMEEMRSPQLPYLTQDLWTCERKPDTELDVWFLENDDLKITVTPQFILGRIGIAYLFANFIYLYSKEKFISIWFISLLITYWLLLMFTSAPGFHTGDFSMQGNFVSYIDRLFMPGSLYLTIHDPEGILSTIPAISTGLLGIMVGSYLRNNNSVPFRKVKMLLIAGFVLIAIAQIWNLVFPINKNLWTSSFTLQAGGISIILLTIFHYIIDIKGYQKWAYFFKVIGMNSILIYISAVFIDWEFTGKSFFGWFAELFGTPYDTIVIILSIMTIKWLFLNFLYKKRIFLKV